MDCSPLPVRRRPLAPSAAGRYTSRTMLNIAAKLRRTSLALAFALAGVLAPALHVHHHSLAAHEGAESGHCGHHHHGCSHDHSHHHEAAHYHDTAQHKAGEHSHP